MRDAHSCSMPGKTKFICDKKALPKLVHTLTLVCSTLRMLLSASGVRRISGDIWACDKICCHVALGGAMSLACVSMGATGEHDVDTLLTTH